MARSNTKPPGFSVLWINAAKTACPCVSRASALTHSDHVFFDRERSSSVVEFLTRDRQAAGLSLAGITVLWSLSKTHLSSLETSAFEELGFEFINFACNRVINTLRLIVYLTGFSI